MTLRLLLGDQLYSQHSWFSGEPQSHVCYVMMEMRQETDYARHHIQKVMAFFSAMRAFADGLRKQGHRVEYLTLDDPSNKQTLLGNLQALCHTLKATSFEYQLPDEYRLDVELRQMDVQLGIPTTAYDSEHFYTSRKEVASFFAGKKTFLMESFYRAQRTKWGLLLQPDGTPEGGQWNYDHANREALPTKHNIPTPYVEAQDLSHLHAMILATGVETMGVCPQPEAFIWPITRTQCLALLEHFATVCLPLFGLYEDAMATRSWSVYHSRLSFALNVKLLSPQEVVARCIAEYRARPQDISLAQIEGFVRQIVGWREYMRGIYWAQMPDFAIKNYFGYTRRLPRWFWTGETKMNCMRHALHQSLDKAYAHHIQRLMVIGNFALLLGTDPTEVDAWYLGVYIDAIEWVEITNTRGMSQYADGGLVASKPYVSSGAYINRMSDYCTGCSYKVKEKVGPSACPFNALYWDFHHRHRALLERNPRIGMAYRTWDKMDPDTQKSLLAQAAQTIAGVEGL